MLYKDVKRGFGLALKNWRGQSGFSQEELAWRASLHRSYLADIERGARNPSLQTIEKLAKALKVSLSTLLQPLADSTGISGASKLAGKDDGLVEILLVEDEARDVELTLEAFKSARLANRVQVVRDGAEAIEFLFCRGKFAKRKIANRPQVMLLDLNLPKVGGLEVLRVIKADERTQKIRVVVLTVSQKDDNIQAALRLGAEAYIVKPVDFQRFSQVTPQLSCQWTLVHSPSEASRKEKFE
jgi:CheY-like chemotaxis protein/DNA-binding XRE family transcriptional regulator